jgi:osmotically-inducible protein OsmY
MKSDDEIRKDVIEEIRWDPQLSNIAAQIGVAVRDEVVTLSGTVAYYAQKLAAENAAQRVNGVKVVAVDIEVVGPEGLRVKTDTQIAEAIRNALTWHSAVNEDLIDIKVDNGWVYLSGTVNWDYERKAAHRAIENLVGVKGVFNKITIKIKTVEPQEIKKKIQTAFHRQASVDSANVSIIVTGNTVILTGKVQSWGERKSAENVAWSTPGVTEVENKLEIDSEIFAD